MTLAACAVDLRAGGRFRYAFERAGGKKIEVRGENEVVEPPRRFVYTESYDFSPLRVHVTTTLDDAAGSTAFTQTLRYASKPERDEDFPGVKSSSKEAFERLARSLDGRGQ